jgi:tetratricopeptide (TPR) repeat protein
MGTPGTRVVIPARVRPLLGVALVVLAAGGCTSLRSLPSSLVPSSLTPATLLSAAKTPAVTLRSGVPTPDDLAAPHRARAEQLENAGRLREAVDAWTTSLALAPGHEPSRQALKRVRERIGRDVADFLRRGWQALARDETAEARRHFLAALALDPDSPAGQNAMRATPVVTSYSRDLPTSAPVTRSLTSRFDAVPSNGIAREEIKKPDLVYAAAREHLASGRDDEAYRALVQLDRALPGYRDASALLDDVRARLVRQRYQDGMRSFREERLEDAIDQWRGVLEIDPTHPDARRNIAQTEQMLRTLASQPRR